MTPAEQLWIRIQRRAAVLSGDLQPLILRAHRKIAEHYSETSIARLIETGQIDAVVEQAFSEAILNAAYAPVREKIRGGVWDTIKYVAKNDLPKRSIDFAFDSLSPDVIRGINELNTKVIQTLKDDNRETVRQRIREGIVAGESPRSIAKDLRSTIGLAPNQEQAVRNFRKALEEGKVSKALGYELRDKRLKVTEEMTPAQIDKAVDAYRTKFIAFNAETNSRTAALDAQKLGQRLSWEQAADQGIVDRSRLKKKWVGVKDSRERPEHLAMEGDTVAFDQPFSNGQMIPGDTEWNCRCVAQYFLSR